MTFSERIRLYARLTRLDKPIGMLLLLWPTLWGLWTAARGWPDRGVLAVFCLGTLLMRSAGCVVNDIADRNIDPHVRRTRERPLAARRLGVPEALGLAAGLCLAAFALVLTQNRLTVLLSVPALFVACSYPFTKRFFALPQGYLGIAFGFGIPMAFAAQTGAVPPVAWLLLLANVFWAIAYDTEYAMVDRDDDVRIGIHTSALLFGRWDVAGVMLNYGLALAVLAVAGIHLGLRPPYYAGLAVAAAIAVHHWWLIRDRDRDGCFRAFRHNNWFGAAIFAGIALGVG